jgi:predicted enzyme related to lactoylglutathione lyase
MDLSSASVGQLMVPVTDMERAVQYYRDVLGLPFLFAAPPQMAFFRCGGVRLLVGVPESAEHRRRGGTIYFRVGDIQAVHATLTARGVAFQMAPHVVHRSPTSNLWLAEFQDPDGNQLALMADVPAAAIPERTE